jgi:serine protease AprX
MTRIFNPLLVLVLTAAALAGPFSPPLDAASSPALAWQDKVDPWVFASLQANAAGSEFLVYLDQQADLSPAASLPTKLEKGAYVYQALSELAARTQPPVIQALDELGAEHRSYWVVNALWVRGGLEVLEAIARRSDVAHIYANPSVRLPEPQIDPQASLTASLLAVEWNITLTGAPEVWGAGFNGQNVVVGGQDTGYDWDHPALINQYRGWDGASADHNYSWHDAIHENDPHTPPGNPCGFDSLEPCDDGSHGTHTMGTIAGDDGGSNQIGMAPGARWIGCRNMEEGWGTPATYMECYEWFIAPTNLEGTDPDPAMAPHVINNSWGCPPSEGCTDPNILLATVESVRAAGIVTVHSAGNSGPSCGTVNTPSAIYEASFTVGATDSSDNIAGFSSRGSVTVDGSNRLKPDVSAPGVNIRSSVPGGGYAGGWSGTSMAGPHVAGQVALMISAQPALAGQVDQIESLTELTALPRTSGQTCGGVPGDQIPNNTYGYGRIRAYEAFLAVPHALILQKEATHTQIEPGGTLTYTLSVEHIHPFDPASNVLLRDALPAGTTLVYATPPYDFDGQTVEWSFASLEAGEIRSVELSVSVPYTATGSIVNDDYWASSDQVEPVSGSPVSTEVVEYSLVVGKTALVESISPGGSITYTLTVTNQHPFAAAHDLVLEDLLPYGTSLIAASEPYTVEEGVISWYKPALGTGQAWQVELVAGLPLTATQNSVDNLVYRAWSVEVAGPVSGPPVSTPVQHTAGLAFGPDRSAEVAPGEVVTYTHWLTNTGLASGTYLLTHESSLGWQVGYTSVITLSIGESIPVQVVVAVPEDAADGAVDMTTITAALQSDPEVTAVVTDTTLVVEPPSWRIYLPLANRP